MQNNSPVELVIVLFVMPWEIDAYRRTIEFLDTAATYLEEQDTVSLDVVLGISDGIVNWEGSIVVPEDLGEAFDQINEKIHWAKNTRLVVDRDGWTLGCCDHRRQHLKRLNLDSTVVWLDPDIIFPPSALASLANGVRATRNEQYVITPQLPRMWDTTWDCLVHKRYTSEPIGLCYEFQPDQVDEVARSLPLPITLKEISEFKFAGGYLTALSANLLQLIDIPNTFRPYGEEDTFVMKVCTHMQREGWGVTQYVIDGLLVAPDFSIQENSRIHDDFMLVQKKLDNVAFNKSITNVEVDKAMQRIGRPPSLNLVQSKIGS